MSSGYGSSSDVSGILGLLGGSLCCLLIPAILSIVVVIWGAQMAQNKGRSAGAWTALNLFFGIIPFIVLCCLPDLTKQQGPNPSNTSTPAFHTPSQSGYAPQQGTTASPTMPASTVPTSGASADIMVTCPACSRKLKVPSRLANSKVRCPSCQGVVDVKAATSGTSSQPTSAESTSDTSADIVVTCPACSKKLKVPSRLANGKVRCPSCQGVIDVQTATSEMPNQPTPAVPTKETGTCECGASDPLSETSCSACDASNPDAPK